MLVYQLACIFLFSSLISAFPADHEPVPVPQSWYLENSEPAPPPINSMTEEEPEVDELTKMKGVMGGLARQLMLTQLFAEERNRGEGQSGVKKARLVQEGTRPYHSATHVAGNNIIGIHEHPNLRKVIGYGEFSAVMNGFEFRTKHSNYNLNMPAHHTWMDGNQEIPYPDVPPEVLNKNTINNEIAEMKKWFEAFRDQDHGTRDYRPYFKPVMCYLEGAFLTSDHKVDAPITDEDHYLKALDWFLAQEEVRFSSYTGRKRPNEDLSYNPTQIMYIHNDTYPVFAHWDYKIKCHPLRDDLPLNRLRVVDDLATRMSLGLTYEELPMSRAARFQLNPANSNTWTEKTHRFGTLDRLMGEIPGKDNYPGDIIDDAFFSPACHINVSAITPLNAAYYNRWFKTSTNDAMGVNFRHRGFSDEFLFVALNTRDKVATTSVADCSMDESCPVFAQKVSYAIPLDIIYLTPLHNWNPYNIEYKGVSSSTEGQTVTANGRNGGLTKSTAFDGTNSRNFYFTPAEFFSGGFHQRGDADTGKESAGVLDSNGNVRNVSPSANHIIMPEIAGVGSIRTRYPIMPVTGEGSSVWKELEALKDIVMQPNTYYHMFREKPDFTPDGTQAPPPPNVCLETHVSTSGGSGPHVHVIELSPENQNELDNGSLLRLGTSLSNSHSHELTIEKKDGAYHWTTCDGNDACWDGHSEGLIYLGQCTS